MIHCQACGGATQWQIVEDRSRPVCLDCQTVTYFDPKLSAGVIVERDGRILLGKRAEGAREAGKWSFPAGFVERGELVEHAAAREAREEMGIDVEIGSLVGLYSQSGDEVVLAVYEVRAFRGEPAAGDDMSESDWFCIDDLPELAFPRDRRILDDWAGSTRDRLHKSGHRTTG